MKKYAGFEAKASVGGSDPLPAGGYIIKILGAKEEAWKNSIGSSLVISFDVSEGEYKSFFADQYKSNSNEDKKWKGNLRVAIPDESNQYFDSQKKTFNNTIGAIEESNAGYHLDWTPIEKSADWSQLKGKEVGVLFRNKEWEMPDKQTGEMKSGWTTEAAYFTTAEYIRGGKFKLPKDKPLKNKASQTNTYQSFAEIADETGDLPF